MSTKNDDNQISDDALIQHVADIEPKPSVKLTELPDYHEPTREPTSPPGDVTGPPEDSIEYGKEGENGSFSGGASDAANGPEMACGSDSAIEAALQAAK